MTNPYQQVQHQSTEDSNRAAEAAVGALALLTNKADGDAEISKRRWATHLLNNGTSKQVTLLKNAAWAYAAGEMLESASWSAGDTVEKRNAFRSIFLHKIPDVPQPGVFWSHSFTTYVTPFTKENVASFFKQCFATLDLLLGDLDPSTWSRVQLQSLTQVFDHPKGYAISAYNAGDLVETWHTQPTPSASGSVAINDLPLPSVIMNEVFGRKWENHPFTRSANYNSVPTLALGGEIAGYDTETLLRCAKDIFGYLLGRLVERGLLEYEDVSQVRLWLAANQANLKQSLLPLTGGDDPTAAKLTAVVLSLKDDLFD